MTDIPEDVMKAAHGLYWRLFTVDDEANNPPADVKHDIEIIATALTQARDKALEDAAARMERPTFCMSPVSAAAAIRAMKSSARQDAGIDKPEMSE